MDYLVYQLSDSHLRAQADASLLCDNERAIAAKRGELYILTRCLLRAELARRLDCPPQSIRFRYNEYGKPECEGIHFNISHSGDCFAMAFDNNPIGIDVERIRADKPLEALAVRIMSPLQLAAFRERGCPVDEFYACWCTAEALVKQAGASVWQAKQHPFIVEHGRIRLPEESPRRVLAFTPLPGYQGALAYLS